MQVTLGLGSACDIYADLVGLVHLVQLFQTHDWRTLLAPG